MLSQHFVDKHQVPIKNKAERMLVSAATGESIGGGMHHTEAPAVYMEKDVSDIKFEVLHIPC